MTVGRFENALLSGGKGEVIGECKAFRRQKLLAGRDTAVKVAYLNKKQNKNTINQRLLWNIYAFDCTIEYKSGWKLKDCKKHRLNFHVSEMQLLDVVRILKIVLI